MKTFIKGIVLYAVNFFDFYRIIVIRGGISSKCLHHVINNNEATFNLVEYLNLGCPKMFPLQSLDFISKYKRAFEVMGEDFISPEEISHTGKFTYSDEQIKYLSETLPSVETLRLLHDNGFLLIAPPPKPLTVSELYELYSNLFYDDSWFNMLRSFELTRIGWGHPMPRWMAIRKNSIPEMKLISEKEYCSNTFELCWAIITFREVRHTWLDIVARTSWRNEKGNRIIVSRFTKERLILLEGASDDDQYKYKDVGIATSYRL